MFVTATRLLWAVSGAAAAAGTLERHVAGWLLVLAALLRPLRGPTGVQLQPASHQLRPAGKQPRRLQQPARRLQRLRPAEDQQSAQQSQHLRQLQEADDTPR